MMMTDGYNLSILLTTATNVRGRVYGSRKTKTILPRLDPDTSHQFAYLLPEGADDPDAAGPSDKPPPKKDPPTSPYNLVSNDPGKAKILYMLDQNGNKLVYSQAKRARQCRHFRTRLMTEKRKKSTVFDDVELTLGDGTVLTNPTVEDVETRYLKEHGLKTCVCDTFLARLNARAVVKQYLKPFYEKIFFRSSKYAVYLATKASNDKLVDKIRNVFGKDGKTIVVFWGNWGQRPNALRNGPSSPGIGLRRFIHRRLANDTRKGVTHYGFTLTVCEMKTSSVGVAARQQSCRVCNACGGNVANIVNSAALRPIGEADSNGEKLYRALRCQNHDCGRAWNRDRLGSRNIMLQALHLLQHHSYHQWLVVNG